MFSELAPPYSVAEIRSRESQCLELAHKLKRWQSIFKRASNVIPNFMVGRGEGDGGGGASSTLALESAPGFKVRL